MVMDPFYYDDTGVPIKDITEWMKGFKKKYLELSEVQFQKIFKKTRVIIHDGPYIEILLFNSKKEILTVEIERPHTFFYMPTVIFYNSTYIKANNINLTNCLVPFFKEVNWKYSLKSEKEQFITNLIGTMYRIENQ